MNNYNENSIKTLEPMEHIRKHTGMYLGSKTAEGLLQCVKEILSNSIDEFLNGSGTTVKITLLKNNGIRIEDDVLVTSKGVQILSNAPKTIEEIERLMRQK